MNDIVKYEPQIEIITFGGDKFFTPAKHKKALLASLNSDRFIEIEGSIVNSRDIRLIKSASVKFDISSVPVEFREAIKTRIKSFKDNLNKDPETEVILKWVNKLKSGETI